MAIMQTVLGLDTGSHALKAVELRQTLRGLEGVQMRTHERAAGQTTLAEEIQHFLRLYPFSSDRICSAIPEDRISARRLDFPFRDHKKLSQAVPFELEEAVPFEIDEIVMDWQLVGGDRNHGVVITAIAQPRDVAQALNDLSEGGCVPRILEAEGLALANLSAVFDLPQTCILADIGHRRTTFCSLAGGQPIAAHSIPMAGKTITEAIAQSENVDLQAAERIKCEHGVFGDDTHGPCPEAVEAIDRIARELVRCLGALEPGQGQASVEVILLGGGAHLQGLDEYLAEQAGVSVRLLSAPEDSEKAALVAGCDPVLFGPAIALALRATPKATTHLNFRQGEFAYRSNYEWLRNPELRIPAILAGLCILLAIASGIASGRLEAMRAEKLERQLSATYAGLFPGEAIPSRPLTALGGAVASARERADFLGLYAGNLSALDLLTLLSDQIPPDLNVRFSEINIDRKVIRIKVSAENYEAQDRLENVLKAESVFAGADVTGSAKRLKNGSVTFGLSIPLEIAGENS